MDITTFFNTVILTTGIFAAIITSTANIVISLMNNRRLKTMEIQKQMNEIDKYRYSKLYDLVLNWDKYDGIYEEKTIEQNIVDKNDIERMITNKNAIIFLDACKRYEIAKPLLNRSYIEELEAKRLHCQMLLNDYIDSVLSSDTSLIPSLNIKLDGMIKSGIEFSKLLKSVIDSQLEELLSKSN